MGIARLWERPGHMTLGSEQAFRLEEYPVGWVQFVPLEAINSSDGGDGLSGCVW